MNRTRKHKNHIPQNVKPSGIKANLYITDELEGSFDSQKSTDYLKSLVEFAQICGLNDLRAPALVQFEAFVEAIKAENLQISQSITGTMLSNFSRRDWPRVPSDSPVRLPSFQYSDLNPCGEINIDESLHSIMSAFKSRHKANTIEGKLWSYCASSELLEHVKKCFEVYPTDQACMFPVENKHVGIVFLEVDLMDQGVVLTGQGKSEFEALQNLIENIEQHPFYSWNWKRYLERKHG